MKGKMPGDSVTARLSEDTEERQVQLPESLRLALVRENLMETYEKLSYTKKKRLALSIESARSEPAKAGRLSRAIEELKPSKKSPIAAYIEGFEGLRRTRLEEIYALIRAEAPGATEKISYEMPTFYLNGNLVHFAAQAKHLGFYPSPSGISAFEAELGPYAHSKGAIQFPYGQALPEALIRAIVRFRVQEAGVKG